MGTVPFYDEMRCAEGEKAKHVQDGRYAKAVASLKEGLPVVFPTDTVYGIGVSVRHAESPKCSTTRSAGMRESPSPGSLAARMRWTSSA